MYPLFLNRTGGKPHQLVLIWAERYNGKLPSIPVYVKHIHLNSAGEIIHIYNWEKL